MLYGPFTQCLPMTGLPLHGSLTDDQLPVIDEAGILIKNGRVLEIGAYAELLEAFPEEQRISISDKRLVAFPAFVDCHTHICWGGTRVHDYAMRVAGKSYLEIAKAGGGIMDSVRSTREASEEELVSVILDHVQEHLKRGIGTIEVKSGYGLSVDAELTMLRAIKTANEQTPATLIPTFLGAHLKPSDFDGSAREYLEMLIRDVVPIIKEENLASRADIFVEEGAFSVEDADWYAKEMQELGFEMTMHVDQFTTGGAELAVSLGCVSADHLEQTQKVAALRFGNSDTVAVALPGASLGLGMQFTPGRTLLDNDACLAIATDWNPGSAPMGDLVTQASILGASEKLTIAETLAGITYRAGYALREDMGTIEKEKEAKIVVFEADDYRSIFYRQGQLRPHCTLIGSEYVIYE
ncbi:MAG: imidazolonepropionase [Balneolaceae bacterium]|nr:imidazolonepropionase [Balneolaceae bacterium]